MSIKLVVIIQCEVARRRCSGFACMKCFYDREGFFEECGYGPDTRYIAFDCGGCCGGSVASHLEHLSNKLRAQTDVKKDEVAVHLASCVTTDNYHHDRCPNLEYIKAIVLKKGYKNIASGTFKSTNATKKRAEGLYKDHEMETFHDCEAESR